jgi:lysophospholipase L1-like esterase
VRKRSTAALLVGAVLAISVTAAGLVSLPGVGGAAGVPRTRPFYLSLGDSYSVGYQPGKGATAGYTAYVAKQTKMRLENFGCGGATTTSILSSTGCTTSGYGPGAAIDPVAYPATTQVAAAVAFIAANPGRVGLVTVSIGGNDVTRCASAPSPVACVVKATSTVAANVGALVRRVKTALTAAGDSTAKIIGLTYPDVLLGLYVHPSVPPTKTAASLADLSVTAFDTLINPTLMTAYTSVQGGAFVDVTSAPYQLATSGDATPLTTTVRLRPYGVVPVAVWEICKLTYYCSAGNIHANAQGYRFIGQLAVAEYTKL